MGLGLETSISPYRLMQLADQGLIVIRKLGGPKKPRYYVLKESIIRFLAAAQ